MTRPIPRSIAILLTAAVVVAAAVVPSHADRASRTDQAGDVWLEEGIEGEEQLSEAGSVVNTDIIRTGVRHTDRSVNVTTKFVKLKKKVSEEIELRIYLRTNLSHVYGVLVHVNTWDDYSYYELFRFGEAGFIRCDLSGSTQFDTEVLKVRVPRSCIGNPKWVRYQSRATSYVEDVGMYSDSAMGLGSGEPKAWSKRLYRG